MRQRVVAKSVAMIAGAVVLGVAAVLAGTASGSPSSGFSSTAITGRLSQHIEIDTKAIKLETEKPIKVINQTAVFQPGGTSGWHSHPGPVFVTVKSGTVTVYDASCTPRSYSAGQSFLEGPDPAVVRNEGTEVSENLATLLVPDDGTPSRIESDVVCPGIP